MLSSWLWRFVNVLRRERVDADLDEEMQFHLAARAEEFVRDGLSPREADAKVIFEGCSFHNGLRVVGRLKPKLVRFVYGFDARAIGLHGRHRRDLEVARVRVFCARRGGAAAEQV